MKTIETPEMNLINKWEPMVEYFRANKYKEEDISQLLVLLETNKERFVKKSYYDWNIFNQLVDNWKKIKYSKK